MNDETTQGVTRVYNLARRLLNNEQDAEDVAEEVLHSFAWELDSSPADPESIHRLYAATVKAAIACREEALNPEFVEAPFAERTVLPGAWMSASPRCLRGRGLGLQREEWQLFEQAMGALPEEHRDVFVLSDVEGLTELEVAALLGVGRPIVKRRLHQARLRMRDSLFGCFGRN